MNLNDLYYKSKKNDEIHTRAQKYNTIIELFGTLGKKDKAFLSSSSYENIDNI